MSACPDCGAVLTDTCFMQGLCSSCGEFLTPGDLPGGDIAPPKIETPQLPSSEEIPAETLCPGCSISLMGSDLAAYNSGSGCPYCGHLESPVIIESTETLPPAPDTTTSSAPPPTPMSDAQKTPISSPSPSLSQPVKMMEFYFIGGSLTQHGAKIELPLGIIGRQQFYTAIEQACTQHGVDVSEFERSLQKTSNEQINIRKVNVNNHSNLDLSMDGLEIEEMGSTNGTILNRDELVGGTPLRCTVGDIIWIAGEFAISPTTRDLDLDISGSVTHKNSGVTIGVSGTEGIHLGRLREDGRREPLFVSIHAQLNAEGKDASGFDYVSRRHAIVRHHSVTGGECVYSVSNIDGKIVEILSDGRKLDTENTSIDVSSGTEILVGKEIFVLN